MCKVVQLCFGCGHRFFTRKSVCGGTFHKQSSSGFKAACSGAPYIYLQLQHGCGCQYLEWDKAWKARLERGEAFLDQIFQKRLPGLEDVTALLELLKQHYDSQAWEERKAHPSADKPMFGRPQLRLFSIGQSSLRHELKPEDIKENTTRSSSPLSYPEVELDANGYPVCFTGSYENPLFQVVSDSTVYSAIEDDEAPPFDADLEFNQGWNRTGSEHSTASPAFSNSDLVAPGPEAKAAERRPWKKIGMQGYVHEPRYEETAKALQMAKLYFWSAVGPEPRIRMPQQQRSMTGTLRFDMDVASGSRSSTPTFHALDTITDTVTILSLDSSGSSSPAMDTGGN